MRGIPMLLSALAIVLSGCGKKEVAPPAPPKENETVSAPCEDADNATAPRKGRFERAGEETGKMIKEGAKIAGEELEKGAKVTGKALDKAGKKTGEVLIKTGEWLVDNETTK